MGWIEMRCFGCDLSFKGQRGARRHRCPAERPENPPKSGQNPPKSGRENRPTAAERRPGPVASPGPLLVAKET